MAERKSHRRNSLVTLTCKHVSRYPGNPPEMNSLVYCARCGDYRRVAEEAFEVKLNCRGCRYARSYGVGGGSEVTVQDAERAAGRHVMGKPHHVVEVIDTDGTVKVIANDPNQGELPLDGVVKGRLTGNLDHQASLHRLRASLGVHGSRATRDTQF